MYIHIHTHTCICTYSVLSHRSPDEPPSRPVISSNPYMIQDYEDIEWEEQNRYLQNDPHRVVLQDGRGCKITSTFGPISKVL